MELMLPPATTYHFENMRLKAVHFTCLPAETTSVYISNCKSSAWGAVGAALASLPSLTVLSVEDCSEGYQLCGSLSRMKSLGVLRMNRCNLAFWCCEVIAAVSSLRQLSIKQNEFPQYSLLPIVKGLPGLAKFEAPMASVTRYSLYSMGVKLTSRAVNLLLNCFLNLLELKLDRSNIEAEAVNGFSRSLLHVRKLSIENNKIGREGALLIARNMEHLTHLHINSNEIGCEAIRYLARSLTSMTRFSSLGGNLATQLTPELTAKLRPVAYRGVRGSWWW